MSTIRQVAKRAHVSIATVSRVLNNQPGVSDGVRSRVLDAVNRCGYIASIGKRATSYLALVYTGPATLGSAYDGAVFAGMGAAMDEGEMDLVLLNLQRDKKPGETHTQFFLRKGVRGVALRTTKRTRATCEAIAAEGFPAVVIGDRFHSEKMSYVYCDSGNTSYQGIEHLVGLGHRRIALAISDIVQDSDHADRLAAYEQAMKDYGLPNDRRLLFHIPASRPDGAQVIRKMMSMPTPPTAVMFTDPIVAVGALIEAQKIGVRIPADLSILGFDDTDVRHHVYPKMTAVCQDARRLGYEAVQILTRLVNAEGQATAVREEFPTWLEINDTTGRPSDRVVRVLPDGTRVADSPSG